MGDQERQLKNGQMQEIWWIHHFNCVLQDQPFPQQNAYSMRANNVSQLVYLADKQARPKAGVVASQYAQIWPSGLLNDPTKRDQNATDIRANVI